MSRIGKLPIRIPDNVNINHNIVSNSHEIIVEGKFGTLNILIPEIIKIEQEENLLKVNVNEKTRSGRSLHGLYRTLINNMIIGVSEQFELILILKGVGYRASVQG